MIYSVHFDLPLHRYCPAVVAAATRPTCRPIPLLTSTVIIIFFLFFLISSGWTEIQKYKPLGDEVTASTLIARPVCVCKNALQATNLVILSGDCSSNVKQRTRVLVGGC